MGTSNNNFLNALISSIRHNNRFVVTKAGFKLKTEDGDFIPTERFEMDAQNPFDNDGNIYRSGFVGDPGSGKIKFRYNYDGTNKYYLPVAGTKIVVIDLYCKFLIPNDAAGGFTGMGSSWELIHSANTPTDEEAIVTFDVNDFISTIELDLHLTTSVDVLATRLVEKFFISSTFSNYDNRPKYFKFLSVNEDIIQDKYGNNQFTLNESGNESESIQNQLAVGDDAICVVHLPDQISTYDHEPIGYELYTEDHKMIDKGLLTEGNASPGYQINWQPGDSVNFTYTNSVLNRIV